jgi:predicted nucleic acid binding AN1-type Zn finger protein
LTIFDSIKMPKKVVCNICSKKLNLAEQTNICKCEKHFCSSHRHFEDHSCSFDYKAQEIKILSKILIEGKSCGQKIEAI